MKIFGVILSPYVARLAIALRHKSIKHDIVMPADGMKTPGFLKMNPLGKMPVLKDGATVLFESGVILEYIDAKYKKKRLIPADAKAAAKTRLLGAMFADYVQPCIGALFGQLNPATRDRTVVDAKVAEIVRLLGIIEKMMGKPYAAGSSLSLADCYAVPALFYVETMLPIFGTDKPLAPHKKLSAYFAKARKDKLLGGVITDINAGWTAWQQQSKTA